MPSFRLMLAAILLTVVMAVPAGRSAPAMAQDDPVQVVATFSILADLVDQVGGESVEVRTLVSANADAHIFEPSPEQVVALAEADVVFANGLGFEPWLDSIVESSGTSAPLIEVTDGITARTASEDAHEGEEDEDADHDHGETDPHAWQDVGNAIVMVRNIADTLAEVDSGRADQYTANADAYIAELEALDAWIDEQVATLPEERRKLVTPHDTFGYYADRYGFEVIGSPLGFSTDAADPAAKDIAALIEAIEAADVPAVFTEESHRSQVMEQIANDAGVTVASLYSDSLGEPDSPGGTYLGMMRSNTESIVEALGA
jgi:zinc/manganese transport system substrate-binding protein